MSLEGAEAWVRRHAQVSGELEQVHVRPWSTVLRVPTPNGALFLKAPAPGFRHEAALVETLAPLAPDLLPTPVAHDRERGWLLLADAGGPGAVRWDELLARYARLQLAAVPEVDALLAAGAPDRRLSLLPDLYTELTGRDAGVVVELCAELAVLGLPETIDHADLHAANVFVRGDERRVVDWGDACVSHPFLSLGVARYFADEAAVHAYLAEWAAFGSRERLRAALPAAMRLAGIHRAATYERVLALTPAGAAADRSFAEMWLDRVLVPPEAWDERY